MPSARRAFFLPLTAEAAAELGACLGGASRRRVLAVRDRAEDADVAAQRCWTALLAGCDSADRWALTPRLRGLSEATSAFVGALWWAGAGAAHRGRVARAQLWISEAISDGDGQEFARAFVGYDHAVASTVVCANQHTGSSTA
ncbi:hypothetical protein CFN78_08945 [Amycolatopsis antarctica]|uniref:Uncharacterized protein n=1 Tax=Amycolatopsis antarctica TaxID=1854586 RepID=A0A263D8S8_9PSEU|nr:hypothetical protein [Amycolatopsis antarctica]OZM73795.1 hypothetical protein CFN78_08945 [Amycolatopsis antarctica]